MTATARPDGPGFMGMYRDAHGHLVVRRDELRRALEEEANAPAPLPVSIYRRRVGRIAAGVTAAIGASLLPILALVRSDVSIPPLLEGAGGAAPMLSSVLVGTLVASLCAYVVGWMVAKQRLVLLMRSGLAITSDVVADIARLEKMTDRGHAAMLADGLEQPSASWLLVGMACVIPLSLHLLVFVVFGGSIASFSNWIVWSLLLTLPGHVALVIMSRRFGQLLRRAEGQEIYALNGLNAWRVTSLFGLLPGAILWLIPPMIIALTGLAFIPVTFGAVRNRIARERAQLAGG